LPLKWALYLHGGLVKKSMLLLSGLLCSYLSLLVTGYFPLYIELPATQYLIDSTSVSPSVIVQSGQFLTSVFSILSVLVTAHFLLIKFKIINNKFNGALFILVMFIGVLCSVFYYVGFNLYPSHYAQLITLVIAGLIYQYCAK
jgi:hypothetical protein